MRVQDFGSFVKGNNIASEAIESTVWTSCISSGESVIPCKTLMRSVGFLRIALGRAIKALVVARSFVATLSQCSEYGASNRLDRVNFCWDLGHRLEKNACLARDYPGYSSLFIVKAARSLWFGQLWMSSGY